MGSSKSEIYNTDYAKSESDSMSHQVECTDLTSKSRMFHCSEFLLRLVNYLKNYLIRLLVGSRQTNFESPRQVGTYTQSIEHSQTFVQPPDHVADAMERFKLSRQRER